MSDHLGVEASGPLPSSLLPSTFKTRAVVISGGVDLTIGVVLLCVGIPLLVMHHVSADMPPGVVLVLIGLLLGFTGLSRITARLEVHETKLIWTWSFSRNELTFDHVTEAALVEPGTPNPGGEWGGFLSGGLLAVGAWWLFGLALSVIQAEPTLGFRTLIVIRQYGAPVRIPPIGTFDLQPGTSQAFAAEQAVQYAIEHFRAQGAGHSGHQALHDPGRFRGI